MNIEYYFKKEFNLFGWNIRVDRRKNTLMGPFGGGWAWALGFKVGRKTLYVMLILVEIRITKGDT